MHGFSVMYWSDVGRQACIMSAWMDGTHLVELVSEGLGWPNGLVVDMEINRLYWADALHNVIEVAELDGSGR